ncbi:hypothetical protein [Pontibacillus litoralis]|uniref:Uncharacterized protein n=1 Tax=Pontibacillus litoralis JSM 072002 TaxID=1385512 RepID=A0A0A5G7S0_9BACI|nr:hypothetical protein [Pontibacillus litoralis]KGX89186.1 hypothetical protein N784_00540 [Pontibacillus litoralis JSM 072002]
MKEMERIDQEQSFQRTFQYPSGHAQIDGTLLSDQWAIQYTLITQQGSKKRMVQHIPL